VNPLAQYTPEQIDRLLSLATSAERAEIDYHLAMLDLEARWENWLSTLFPQFIKGGLATYQEEYWGWLWSALMAKRKGLPLPDGENAFMSIWSRGNAKSTHTRLAPVAEAAILGKGFCVYLGGVQDQANKHLGSIATLLTSEKMKYYYPQLTRPKIRNTDSKSRAWNQKMLHLDCGYIIQGIGLDVGIRGANIDEMRVTMLCPDDIDDISDTPMISEQKMDKFLHSILPTKKAGTLFPCAQNLVIEHGVINRIVTGQVPALANARISGPHPRVLDLKTDRQIINGRPRDIVLSGEVTWPGNDSLERVQEDIDTYTLPVFLKECQHQLHIDRTGLVLSPWDDAIHVITEEEFEAIFHYKGIPVHWNKEIVHDWAKSKSAYHANVVMKVAVSSQNEPLPGHIFLYDPMSFEENTQADDVAIRILESISQTVDVNGTPRTWKEILDAEFGRLRLENFVSNATALIAARREILARIIPPLVGPLLRRYRYRRLRMSHEAKDQRNIYRRVYGLPFTACNPRKEGGIEFANHYFRVFNDRRHPFKDRQGWSQMFVLVPNDKKNYPLALRPDSLHDHDLLRYQFAHWRHTEPHLTTTGILEHGPEKMNDDFGQALQMAMLQGGLAAEPLSYDEKVEELIPIESRLQSIMYPAPLSYSGRKTMTPADQLAYTLAREVAQAQVARTYQQYDEYGDPII
jgi:hypothetical protein